MNESQDTRSPIIKAAMEHFSSKGIRKFTVPEWVIDGKPLEVYQRPITVKEKAKYNAAMTNSTFIEAQIVLIMECALDKDGEKLFDIGDRLFLMNNVEQDVIASIFLEISKQFESQGDLAEK